MSLNTDILNTDLGNVIDDLPTVLTYQGNSYLGISGTFSKEAEIGMAGIGAMSDVEFSTRAILFSTEPKPKQTATLDGKSYIIDRVVVSADGVQIQLFMTQQKASATI